MSAPPSDPAAQRARQRKTVQVTAILLIAVGAVVLLFLEKMPLPIRLLVGIGDVFAGLVLLVLVRQKFGE